MSTFKAVFFLGIQLKFDQDTHDVIQALRSANLCWWIDSGTLLGFVRDNSIIEWDTDVDLSILVECELGVQTFIDALVNQGRNVRIYYYQNRVVKLKVMGQHMNVDIQVFRRVSNQLISFFAYYGAKPNTHSSSIINLFYRASSRFLLRKIEMSMYATGIINISLLKLLFCARVGSWVYEVDDILPLQRLNGLNLPRCEQKYLTVRYGLWRHPNNSWNSYTMDGARKY